MSNPVQLHLLVNHIPVLLPVVGLFIYLAGWIFKTLAVERTGLILLMVGGLSAYPAHETGEKSENEIRSYPCRGKLLEDHEEAAETATKVCMGLGVLSLLLTAASFKKKGFAHSVPTRLFLIVLALGTFGLMARTAHLGGLIGHEELQPNWKTKPPNMTYCQ